MLQLPVAMRLRGRSKIKSQSQVSGLACVDRLSSRADELREGPGLRRVLPAALAHLRGMPVVA
jgi:hypothetical protein